MENSDNTQQQKADSFRLNREIAYLGIVGHLREEFCINFIRKKQEFFKELTKQQEETLSANSETLSCFKGCSRCCSLFIGASV